MKISIKPILLLLLFILLNCSDKTITEPLRNIVDESIVQDVNSINQFNNSKNREKCCQFWFPTIDDYFTNSSYECTIYFSFEGFECAKLWAEYHHNPDPYVHMNCAPGGEPEIPSNVPPVLGLTGMTIDSNPHLSWTYTYSHYIQIERKIGDNSWTTLLLQNNRANGNSTVNLPPNPNFTDTSINLNQISEPISYKVKTKLFNELSVDNEIITYQPQGNNSIFVIISGPNQLNTIQWGTFFANVTNGIPNYDYEWWKYQECNDDDRDSKNGSRTLNCGRWIRLNFTDQSIIANGNIPGFNLKVIVNDLNGNSAYDYHFVRVPIP